MSIYFSLWSRAILSPVPGPGSSASGGRQEGGCRCWIHSWLLLDRSRIPTRYKWVRRVWTCLNGGLGSPEACLGKGLRSLLWIRQDDFELSCWRRARCPHPDRPLDMCLDSRGVVCFKCQEDSGYSSLVSGAFTERNTRENEALHSFTTHKWPGCRAGYRGDKGALRRPLQRQATLRLAVGLFSGA